MAWISAGLRCEYKHGPSLQAKRVAELLLLCRAEAAKLAVAAGVPAEAARWVESDVFAAPEALNGEVFDLVVSTVGTLCWLPSVRDYARVVSKCLAPGGTFYIRDGHPMLMTLADDQTDGYNDRPKDAKGGRDLLIAYPYFETAAPLDFDDGGTYADPNAVLTHTQTHEWNHPLGLIVTELINAGLVIEFLHEHKELDWRFLDTMRRASDDSSQQPAAEDVSASAAEQTTTGEAGFGGYQFPAHQRDCVPCMFSLRARKPAAADMLPGQCPTDKDKKKGD
eukprot:SAG31_NODE_482_length_15056_cov_5.057364_6_plen_280_part_00